MNVIIAFIHSTLYVFSNKSPCTIINKHDNNNNTNGMVGLVVRALNCLSPMWPAFNFRTRCDMWIEFVGSLLCPESFFFPQVLWFSPTFDLI